MAITTKEIDEIREKTMLAPLSDSEIRTLNRVEKLIDDIILLNFESDRHKIKLSDISFEDYGYGKIRVSKLNITLIENYKAGGWVVSLDNDDDLFDYFVLEKTK